MQKKELLYEGKAKKVYTTEDPEVYIVSYKDDATAFNGLKKGTIAGKGVVNNEMSNFMFRMLEEKGVPTHYVEELNERETAVKKVTIIPLEVIVRNVAAGSLSKRLGLPEGTALKCPVLEFSYKNDELGDPMVNDYHILAMDLATREELDKIAQMSFQINQIMVDFFKTVKVDLIDFKLEFGKTSDGTIILADEISPDTCRFWDSDTHEKLDKDRFRRDMGGVEEAYEEMMRPRDSLAFFGNHNETERLELKHGKRRVRIPSVRPVCGQGNEIPVFSRYEIPHLAQAVDRFGGGGNGAGPACHSGADRRAEGSRRRHQL